MRNVIFLGFVCLLTLAASAQQNNNLSSDAAGAGATASTSDREPLASPSKDFWEGDDPNLINLMTHPFANKKYVQRQLTPIRDRIHELEQITSENSQLIKDV